jgi:HD-like signal output (HDOD) protein/CheY-like chemotaxis protein
MKEKILFVGQDQFLWEEFRDYSEQAGSPWLAEAATSAADALSSARNTSYAAVVADAQLVDSTGLEMLDEFLRLQPKSFRIVVSDFADTATTIQCVGRGHHHLSKPCDVRTLLNALDRASVIEHWHPALATQSLISQMKKVPSPPTIYFQIVSETQSPDCSLDRVGELISQDPAISAKILQLANSAVFGLQLQVSQPAEAVAYIGLQTTKSLVLMAYTFSSFDKLVLTGFSVESLWRHSVLAGRFARKIASIERASPEIADQSFTAGLLHDIGLLMFAANLPDELGWALTIARDQRRTLWDAETELLGASHADVGGCLLGLWGLPKPIVEAVALHHYPSRLAFRGFSPLVAAHAANVLAHEVWPEQTVGVPAEMDFSYLSRQDLAGRVDDWREACKNALDEPS